MAVFECRVLFDFAIIVCIVFLSSTLEELNPLWYNLVRHIQHIVPVTFATRIIPLEGIIDTFRTMFPNKKVTSTVPDWRGLHYFGDVDSHSNEAS
jgi:hypothetical protein